jgi:hypothetical protein
MQPEALSRWTPAVSTRCSRLAPRASCRHRGGSPMDGRLLLRLERCVRCRRLFVMCRRCYHGQTYCSDDCRKPARASQLSTLRAKH